MLHDITVTIQRGKLTSLIGPNGAGKSTLLSAISRIVKHDQGEIVIEGHAIKDFNHNDLSKKLSILKQSNHTDMNITVEQLVQFGR
ncbi:MAG: ATP-binding cassette domain-containing protein, partial [Staphylococcus lugdunensis]|nr:ATP-binding cassette domain-containing protein [Staphylococcus lugdunensis]